jgi:hypothetical protein
MRRENRERMAQRVADRRLLLVSGSLRLLATLLERRRRQQRSVAA